MVTYQAIAALLCILPMSLFAKILDVDYEESVGISSLGKSYFAERDLQRLELYKGVWEKNRPAIAARKAHVATEQEKIPKVLHFLWLSEKPPTKKCRANLDSWTEHHPKWRYKVWTLKEVESLDDSFKELFEKASSQQQKEDFLRAYLLEKEGGVVVDLEFQNLYPIDELVERYHFFSFLEPPLTKKQFSRKLHVSTAFIGATPLHPVIKAWSEAMRTEDPSSPLFGKSIDSLLDSDLYINIIFPPTYAFPLNSRWAKVASHKQKSTLYSSITKAFRAFVSWFEEMPLFSEVRPESIAVHIRGGRWEANKNSKLSKKDRDREN